LRLRKEKLCGEQAADQQNSRRDPLFGAGEDLGRVQLEGQPVVHEPQSCRGTQSTCVDGYAIHWKGFGRIVLGEVHVKGNGRCVTLVRLAIGSDAGGPGAVRSGQSNGRSN
jgi:hypothetical protein